MNGQSQDLKELLLQTDADFRALAAKHHELEDRLHELAAKPYLSEPEQLEEVNLKKRKLQLKDRMEDVIRQYRETSTRRVRGVARRHPAARARLNAPPTRGRALARPHFTPSSRCVSITPAIRSCSARWHWPPCSGAAVRLGRRRCRSPCSPRSSCSSSAIPTGASAPGRDEVAVARRRPRDGGRRRRCPTPRPPGQWQQISIFLSPMDVHVNRVPASGRITRVEFTRGRFLPAYRPDAARVNERSEIWIDHGGQTIVARQIVGVLARRVVCRAGEGRRGARRRPLRRDEVRIAHGRVPAADARRFVVTVGERVRGGETVIAVLH